MLTSSLCLTLAPAFPFVAAVSDYVAQAMFTTLQQYTDNEITMPPQGEAPPEAPTSPEEMVDAEDAFDA